MQTAELYLAFVSFEIGNFYQSVHANTIELIQSVNDLRNDTGMEIMSEFETTQMLERLALEDECFFVLKDNIWISVQVATDYSIEQTIKFNHQEINHYANI